MNDMNRLQDALHTEMMNQMKYNMYVMNVLNPEVRQMFMNMRDGKMQQITQLQGEINKMMSGQ